MALTITKWDPLKIILFIFDILLLLLNSSLLVLTFILIYKEYYSRSTLKLFLIPFVLSIINVVIDLLMNIKNFNMRYAGHNRYGMITRFFMFYCIMTIMIYSDQRTKYINQNIGIYNFFIILFGFIDIGLLMLSMIMSFSVIDVESIKRILVKKNKRTNSQVSAKTVERVKSLSHIEISDIHA